MDTLDGAGICVYMPNFTLNNIMKISKLPSFLVMAWRQLKGEVNSRHEEKKLLLALCMLFFRRW